jgi:proteasome assembly chaperone (PAC2) family protein
MAKKLQLNQPWLVAVWPGMGNVALNAGIYLLSKLDMNLIADFEATELEEVDQIEVKDGVIQLGRQPRNRLFVWIDPNKQHDLVVFLGETQPRTGVYSFCRQLIDCAKDLGVTRVFTFAAMATKMHPEHASRVFGAATDAGTLNELTQHEIELLKDGNIRGLNGLLLGAALSANLPGACLLGEMPHIFSQLPFPKASLAILHTFTTLTGIEIDFTELAEQARATEEQLGELLARVEQAYQVHQREEEDEESFQPEPAQEDTTSAADRRRIEAMFKQAKNDRSRAFELKRELDRLGIFQEYEDRFLDLFQKKG